jgi:hypothetical protein
MSMRMVHVPIPRDCMASVTPATRSRPGRRHAPEFRSAWRSPRRPRRGSALPRPIRHALAGGSARGVEGSPRSPTRPVRRRIARHTIAHDRIHRCSGLGGSTSRGASRQTPRPGEVCRAGQSTTSRPVRDARKTFSVDSEGGGGGGGGVLGNRAQKKKTSQNRGAEKF